MFFEWALANQPCSLCLKHGLSLWTQKWTWSSDNLWGVSESSITSISLNCLCQQQAVHKATCPSVLPGCSLPHWGSSAGRRSLVHHCLLPGHSLSVWQTARTSSSHRGQRAAQWLGPSWRREVHIVDTQDHSWLRFHMRETHKGTENNCRQIHPTVWLTCWNSGPRSPAEPR